MASKIKKSKIIYRRLKISDFDQFKILFYSSFKRKVSFDFYKTRYFSDNNSFCYGAFKSSKLIANVGMISLRLNNKKKEKIFSRHSSMVLKKYRNQGIYSNLLEKVKVKISKKIKLIVMWPNKNNFSNFGIDKDRVIYKKLYIYRNTINKSLLTKNSNYNINQIIKFKDFIENKNSFFYKNFIYFKYRYLLYKKNEYFINRFDSKKLKSFFILKRHSDKRGINYILLDHFGSQKIKSEHLSYLIKNQKKLVFLSKIKLNKSKLKIIDFINFKIGYLNKSNKKEIFNKEIYLGDTDIFINFGKS